MMNRTTVYEKILAKNGIVVQAVVALEELSEAQKEICKCLRDEGSMEHLAEEIADATIMLEQITQYYGIGNSVREYMNKKLQKIIAMCEK